MHCAVTEAPPYVKHTQHSEGFETTQNLKHFLKFLPLLPQPVLSQDPPGILQPYMPVHLKLPKVTQGSVRLVKNLYVQSKI